MSELMHGRKSDRTWLSTENGNIQLTQTMVSQKEGRPGFLQGWLDCQPPQIMTKWLFPDILKHLQFSHQIQKFFLKLCIYLSICLCGLYKCEH